MERMNELLEKYFNGTTDLTEEKALKQYFAGTNIAKEHEPYRALFNAFGDELTETAINPLKKVSPKQKSIKRIWIRTFAYSGIAATILIALWIQRPNQSENYAIVSGNRIEDPEYVQEYTEKKLNKVNEILHNSMKPMKSVETVRQSLQPIQKIVETRRKLEQIENNIQFK
jgi:hypothetical protein